MIQSGHIEYAENRAAFGKVISSVYLAIHSWRVRIAVKLRCHDALGFGRASTLA